MKVLLLVDDADEQTLYRHHLEAGVEDLHVVAHAPATQGPLPREFHAAGYDAVLIEIAAPDAGYFAALGPKLNAFYLERDILLRSLGNIVYAMPPYCIGSGDLDRIYDVIEESLAVIGA